MGEPFVAGGRSFATLQAALDAAPDGGEVQVLSGTYRGVGGRSSKSVVVRSVNGPVIFDGGAIDGKATLVLSGAKCIVDGISGVNIRVPDGNGALVRYEGQGTIAIRNAEVWNSEGVVLTNNDKPATVILESCHYHDGLAFKGTLAHPVYAGFGNRYVYLRGCVFRRVNRAHLVKSRAAETIIDNCFFEEGGASYSIDCPNGGVLAVQRSTFIQTWASDNYAVISIGGEVSSGRRHSRNELHFSASNRVWDSTVPLLPLRVFKVHIPLDARIVGDFAYNKGSPPADPDFKPVRAQ